MARAERPEGEGSLDPAIASYVALVWRLSAQLSCADEPAQFIQVLEQGTKTGNDDR